MRILIAGSRYHSDTSKVEKCIKRILPSLSKEDDIIIHAGHPTGTDICVEKVCRSLGLITKVYKQQVKSNRLANDILILKSQPDVCIIFTKGHSCRLKNLHELLEASKVHTFIIPVDYEE